MNEHQNTVSTNQFADESGNIIKEIYLEKKGNLFGFSIKGGIKTALGIHVTNIDKDSVAELKGLQVNDEILSINDVDFTRLTIHEAIGILLKNQTAKLKIKRIPQRSKKTEKFELKSPKIKIKANQPIQEIKIVRPDFETSFGFTINCVIESTHQIKFVVTGIKKESPSGTTNLKLGDQIVQVNGRKILTIEDFTHTLETFKNSLELVMQIKRDPIDSKSEIPSEILVPDKRIEVNSNQKRSSSTGKIDKIVDPMSDLESKSKNQMNHRKTADIYEKILKSNSSQNKIQTELKPLSESKLKEDSQLTYRFELPSAKNTPKRKINKHKKSLSVQHLLNASEDSSNRLVESNGYASDLESDCENRKAKQSSEWKSMSKKAFDWSVPFVRSSSSWNVHSSNKFEENDLVCKIFRRETKINSKGKDVSYIKKERTVERLIKNFDNAAHEANTYDNSIPIINIKNNLYFKSQESPIELKINNLHKSFEDEALINKNKTKIEYEQSFALLPCTSEIWFPIDECILNIETETVIPEVILNTKILSDYEYSFDGSEVNNNNNNRSKLNSYKSKSISSNIERTPDGLVSINLIKLSHWDNSLGLKLSKINSSDFKIVGFKPNGMASKLDLFEIGMVLFRINDKDLKDYKAKEAECLIEQLYINNKQIKLLIKPN